ncbi:nucleolar complex-associated protein 3-like [Punica granatum]|uniref:Nucleolar complex-associated protein 3-like n=1 Tax=Punica granatum TaxID=22663 RepID=A0A6P8BZA9_PUNGR|nr:nucleolar complex-associated protein 3-like [Punica granatum]
MVKQKVILPPELPPEIPEEEIVPSEEDVEFFTKNRGYTRFVYGLDTQTISELLTRPAGVKEDDLEALYEKKRKKEAAMQQKEKGKADVQVDPVDALPVKTLDGKLYYRTLLQVASDEAENAGNEDGGSEAGKGSVGKLTKAERRAKLKKLKKEAKKQGKESPQPQAAQDTPQAVVLAEVKEELTAEEAFESKKRKLAELGDALLADPESNIKSLKELLHFCKDAHHRIVILGLLSLSAVFKDIIPGYRIRLPTEKELEMKVSKDVKR